jgi:Zinc knuckle
MIASTGFAGTCYTCGEVGHRSSDHFDQGRHHNRYLTRHGAQGAENHADGRHGDRRADHRQGLGGARQAVARQDEERHERARQEDDQRRNHFEDNGNNNAHCARAAPAIAYHRRDLFDNANLSSDDDQFDRAASAIAAAHHVGDKIHSHTVAVDSGTTWRMFYDLPVFQKLEFIVSTTVKLGDDSTTDCTQIGEVVLDVSDGRRIRLTQVLYVPRLAINLLSVSQLAKNGIIVGIPHF